MVKKVAIGLAIAALLAAVGVGAVLAQESTPTAETPAGMPVGPGEGPGGHGRPGGPGGQRDPHGEHLDIIAEVLGMTPDELREALASGQTIAELAEAQGVPLQDVADALVAAETERLQQAVEDGRLTQEEAVERLALMEENILERLESGERGLLGGPGGPRGMGGPGKPGGPHIEHLDVIAEVLGMTPDEVREAVSGGQTIAELAEAQSVPLQDVADALVAAEAERLQQAVEDGRLTQEEADKRLALMEENILERLESGERGLGGPGGPRGTSGPGNPRGPYVEHLDVIAEVLGMTPDEAREALTSGQTIAELAEAQGVPLQDVADAMVAAEAERLQQAVEDGRLTQEQADERLALVEQNVLEHLESGEPGPGGPCGTGGPSGPGRGEGGKRGPRPSDE
jgi:transcriptional regulator with XRE-family HTH domain